MRETAWFLCALLLPEIFLFPTSSFTPVGGENCGRRKKGHDVVIFTRPHPEGKWIKKTWSSSFSVPYSWCCLFTATVSEEFAMRMKSRASSAESWNIQISEMKRQERDVFPFHSPGPIVLWWKEDACLIVFRSTASPTWTRKASCFMWAFFRRPGLSESRASWRSFPVRFQQRIETPTRLKFSLFCFGN